jgi:hypothetical protein
MFSTQDLIEIVERIYRDNGESSINYDYSVVNIVKYVEKYLFYKRVYDEIEYSDNDDSETEEYYRNISYKREAEEIDEGFDIWDYDRINALSLIFQIRPILKFYSEEFVEEIAKLLIEPNIKELELYNGKRKKEHKTIENCLNDFELDSWCYLHVKSNIDHEKIKNKYPLMVKILSYK